MPLGLGSGCGDSKNDEGSTASSASAEDETTGPVGDPGSFTLLTYNVAALPQGLSSGDPETNVPLISPLLNDFDIVLAQEDFWYHALLNAEVTHPHKSVPYNEMPTLEDIGDGLNRFSIFPFEMHERAAWFDCNGQFDCANDCLATKGWSFARHTIDTGIEIDIYNLHMEAGGCPRDEEIRAQSADDLIAEIATRSEGRAVIVAGDFNLHVEDASDLPTFNKIVNGAMLLDACWEVECGNESIDRVLYRSSTRLDLAATSWEQPAQFVDAMGGDLSDHEPTSVTMGYTPR